MAPGEDDGEPPKDSQSVRDAVSEYLLAELPKHSAFEGGSE